MGGISRTVNFKGNRIDIGGHRFFSKSDRVMEWWLRLMPVEEAALAPQVTVGEAMRSCCCAAANRASIFFASSSSIRSRSARRPSEISAWRAPAHRPQLSSGGRVSLRKIDNLEQFFISRFGRELYETVLQVLHRKGVGSSVQRHQRGMGRTAHQRAFDHARRCCMC